MILLRITFVIRTTFSYLSAHSYIAPRQTFKRAVPNFSYCWLKEANVCWGRKAAEHWGSSKTSQSKSGRIVLTMFAMCGILSCHVAEWPDLVCPTFPVDIMLDSGPNEYIGQLSSSQESIPSKSPSQRRTQVFWVKIWVDPEPWLLFWSHLFWSLIRPMFGHDFSSLKISRCGSVMFNTVWDIAIQR